MERIIPSLKRQLAALKLLFSLQQQEYKLLIDTQKQGLQKNQFSIQRLINHILNEKQWLKKYIEEKFNKSSLMEVINEENEEVRSCITGLIKEIKSLEKKCMDQATINADLAIAHLEQTKELVNFLYDNLRPKAKNFYSRQGILNEKTEGPCIFSGRL